MDMNSFNLRDGTKFWIFYGFIILGVAWGLIDSFFVHSFRIYLGFLILGLMVWIWIVCRNMMNVVMPAGSVRFDNTIKIPCL